jgi:predicted metalloprotease with PDZ domain
MKDVIGLAVVCAALTWAAMPKSQGQAQAPPLGPQTQAAGGPLLTSTEPGFLGMVVDDRQENGAGVRVLDCMPGGPAASSGLKAGDLITSVAGKPIRSMTDFATSLVGSKVGSALAVDVTRSTGPVSLVVTMGRRPPETSGAVPTTTAQPTAKAQPPAIFAAESPEQMRIEALERRMAELEQRIKALEQAPRGPTLPSP